MSLRIKYISYGAAVIGIIAVASVFIFARWSGRVTEVYTFPTGKGQEAITVTCSTNENPSRLNEVAFEAFETFETGFRSIAESGAKKMQEAMEFANENGGVPDFSEIKPESIAMTRELLDEVEERYGCVINSYVTRK